MNFFKKIANKVKDTFNTKKMQLEAIVSTAVAGTEGEAYVDTGVKILIAVVIGALLLGLLYALFSDTIMPTVTQKVQDLFNYNG